MKNINKNISDDINIILFTTVDTIDESNVLSMIENIKDNSLTVIKHDLSS